ncbi:MAG: ATP-binding cassette domain-containing protein [Spirochaetia bacterium]|jgi:putative ABC transport system ATP-binding protein
MGTVELAVVGKMIREGTEERWILKGIDAVIEKGELALLLGPSGSGKTTLLTLIAGLVEPSEGWVCVFGRRLSDLRDRELQAMRACRIGFIFQNFLLIDSFSGWQNAEISLRFAGFGRAEAERTARKTFAALGITELGPRKASDMSHGERQRVAVARALAASPQLVLADEPTASLESGQGAKVIETIHAYVRESGATAIVASHDGRLAALSDRTLELRDGRLNRGAEGRKT